MSDILVIAAEEDQDWVQWIDWVLVENGHSVSQQVLNSRQANRREIATVQDAIEECDIIIILFSDDWLQSDASAIIEPADYPLVSIRVEKCEPSGEWAPFLDLVDQTEEEAERSLLDAVSNTEISPARREVEIGEPYSDGLRVMRRSLTVKHYVEPLVDGLGIEMTFIPGGTFLMGSPEDEPERGDDEGPQHEVTVPSFFMGTYPITQAQWRVVASYAPVDRELEPDPSDFKGNNRPVEQVSWEEAIECCKRLSRQTNRAYRLPSEAEWEYACRAGTDTPFHFGPTITTDYANYCGDGSAGRNPSYGLGPAGDYRKETTSVSQFEVSNAFGLFDMHGNVFEWCEDDYHSSYDNAPVDGRAWIDEPRGNSRILRGGAWDHDPDICRSASRDAQSLGFRYDSIGFRVVVSAPGLSSS